MKRKSIVLILAALAALLLAGCVSAPPAEAPGLDPVIHRWITGLHEEDIELIMSTYWPEAELFMPQAEGGEQLLRGSEEIRRLQQSGFDLPMSWRDLRIVEVDRQVTRTSATVRLHVGGTGFTNLNTLDLQRRGDEWRIIYQVLEPAPGS